VYIANPINFASLKFSGKFLVFTAYMVQRMIKKKQKPKGAKVPEMNLHKN